MCVLLSVISEADTQVCPLNSDRASPKYFTQRGRLMNTLVAAIQRGSGTFWVDVEAFSNQDYQD